jgi:uncharacterized protein with NRDE domain
MCTLSLFKNSNELIITMNRDESRQRHEAGLKEQTQNNIHSLFPVDGLAGGTWFGINDTGVVMALLNRYQDPQVQGAPTRGQIIPTALTKGRYTQILSHLNKINFSGFNPFDLFLIEREHNHHFSWSGQVMTITQHNESAIQFSSSGVDTDLVLAKRQARFEQQLAHQNTWQAPQILEKLHLHQDPQETSHSVLMDRPHTHSKSICQVHLRAEDCQFAYYPETSLTLWREHAVSADQLPYQQRESIINLPFKDFV